MLSRTLLACSADLDHWHARAVVSVSKYRAAPARWLCRTEPSIPLSKCRGGACRVAKPEAVRRQAQLGAFWSCYTLGFFIRLPLVMWAGIKAAMRRISIFARTYHQRLDLLDGKLTILFLNGFLPNTVPLLLGNCSRPYSTME